MTGPALLDFEAIARDARLLSDADIRLSDKQTPIHERGIRLDWLIDFVKAVERGWQEVLSRRDSQRRASMNYDTVPWPDPLPVSDQQEMTAEFVVEYAVRPLTAESRAPLYSRVPPEHRGRPNMFVSHAWSNPLIGGNAFTTLYAIKHPYKSHSAVEFVWLDVACYNQHRVEVVAADMKAVISSIGRIALPMINAAPFGRLWCLWELLCAHVGGAAVDLWEANGSPYDIGFSARRFTEDFAAASDRSRH